jgi:hypothetical protein
MTIKTGHAQIENRPLVKTPSVAVKPGRGWDLRRESNPALLRERHGTVAAASQAEKRIREN